MISDFHVVRWVEIEERAATCRKVGFEGTALCGGNAARSRGRGSIGIELDGRSLCREVFCDLDQSGSVASARIHCKEGSWRYQELSKVARFLDGQRVMTKFQTPCIAHGSAPFSLSLELVGVDLKRKVEGVLRVCSQQIVSICTNGPS